MSDNYKAVPAVTGIIPMYTDETQGMVLIKKVGNGYIVTLPVKRQDDEMRRYMPLIGAIADKAQRDPLLDKLQGNDEPAPVKELAYEMNGPQNVFVFDTWEKVLEFLAVKFDAAEAEKE